VRNRTLESSQCVTQVNLRSNTNVSSSSLLSSQDTQIVVQNSLQAKFHSRLAECDAEPVAVKCYTSELISWWHCWIDSVVLHLWYSTLHYEIMLSIWYCQLMFSSCCAAICYVFCISIEGHALLSWVRLGWWAFTKLKKNCLLFAVTSYTAEPNIDYVTFHILVLNWMFSRYN